MTKPEEVEDDYDPADCGDHCSCLYDGSDDGVYRCCDCTYQLPCDDLECEHDRCITLRVLAYEAENHKLDDVLDPQAAKFIFETVLKVPPDEMDFNEVSRVEVHNYCEYRIFDLHNQLVKVQREMGY